jgi:hypothetical protein
MKAALTGQLTPVYNPKPRKTTRKDTRKDRDCATVDISMISAASFVYNCQDPGAALFSITLEEIDYEIQDRQVTDQPGEATNAELVACKLPAQYQDLADVFSQANSNKLLLHCTIDYKIVLEQENLLGISLLYQMSLSEL